MRWLIGVVVVLGLVAGGFAVGIAIGDEEDDAGEGASTTTTEGASTSTTLPDLDLPTTYLVVQADEGTFEDGKLTLQTPSHAAFVDPLGSEAVALEDVDNDWDPGLERTATFQVAGDEETVTLTLTDLEVEGGELTFEAAPSGETEPPATFLQAFLFVEIS